MRKANLCSFRIIASENELKNSMGYSQVRKDYSNRIYTATATPHILFTSFTSICMQIQVATRQVPLLGGFFSYVCEHWLCGT